MPPLREGFRGIAPLLSGRVIALPETRESDVLAALMERRGAQVLRCPLVSIVDAPDPAPIERWLRAFIAHPPDCFVLLTGEGVRRLCGFADRAGLLPAFVAALGRVQLLARGPKPGRALAEQGLTVDLRAASPTTDGVIETLTQLEITGRAVAVQLYGNEPNLPLMECLAAHGAQVSVVAPYRYVPKSQDRQVLALIDALAARRADAMVFTSKAQVQRLFRVAETGDRKDDLVSALGRIVVAAVGPVVVDELAAHGVSAGVVPQERYFMKPLVSALAERLGQGGDARSL